MANTTKKSNSKSLNIRQFLHSPMKVTVASLVVVLLAGGGAIVAAKQSKPGDPLYGVGQAVEEVQLAFSFTDGMKESTHRSIAKERLGEIKALFAEKNINASGIATALANFEQQKTDAVDLAKKVGTSHATEVEDELSGYESEIDALFEARQADLEGQREALKNLYEQAKKTGDTVLAAQLQDQIDAFKAHLKDLEVKREESKQQQEQFVESLQKQNGSDDSKTESDNEAVKQKEEALSEAVKQEVEAQNEAAQRLAEQVKEAQERQAELLKEQQQKAAEEAQKAAEKQQQEQEKQQEDNNN